MTLSIQRPEEVVSAEYARWGLYGDNGSGKTTFLSTIPPTIPTLVASADDENVKPLIGKPHIRVVKIRVWNDLRDLILLLQDMVRKHEKDPSLPMFRCLAFDTWTRIQALAANKLTGYAGEGAVEFGKEAQFIDKAPKLPRGYDEWQTVGALAGEWMRYFQRLPMHTIFLFQEQTRAGKKEWEGVETGPAMTPEAIKHVRDSLELLGRLYVDLSNPGGVDDLDAAVQKAKAEQGKASSPGPVLRKVNPERTERRLMLIGKEDGFITKGPTHVLGRIVEDPTWDKLAASLGKKEK